MCSSVHVMQKIDSFRAVNFQTDARHFSVKTVEKQQHKSITDVRRLVLVKKTRQINRVHFLFTTKLR